MSEQQKKSMRVVHIISGLGQGGAETVLYRLSTAPDQDIEHIVISLGDADVFGPRLQHAGVVVYCLGMKSPWRFLKGVRSLVQLLKQLRPDVVQTWMYHSDLVGGLAARAAGIKAVSWGIRNSGANLYQGSPKSRFVAWLCARISQYVPRLIISCAENAARRHKQWGYKADIMKVIPNGYDLSRWQHDSAVRERVRAELQISVDTPLIGSVARWNPLKDHANLLSAVARSVRQHPELRCVLIGEGMHERNVELMRLIAMHQLREHVLLLGIREDVPELMNALDVHVLSSHAEGFPNVVCEAMAVGVSCVVTDVGDAALIVGNEGWVVPPRNAEALSGAINSAIQELGSTSWRERHKHARERVQRLFSLQSMVQAYAQAWHELSQNYPTKLGSDFPQAPITPASLQAQRALERPTRLLFLVNNPAFFLSHRLPLALAAQQQGYEVHVATMPGPSVMRITDYGIAHHALPMTRSGKNPLTELRTVWAIYRLFKQLQPEVVHAVTIKPVLYGGIAARLSRVPGFLAAISGLGYIFTRQKGFDPVRQVALGLYKLALGHSNSKVIFQNTADRDVLLAAGVLQPEQAVLIRGSGVDLERCSMTPEPPEPIVVVMASRLLFDKGVREFVAAARLSREQGSDVRWKLFGSPDSGNPASVSVAELSSWQQGGVIEYGGEQEDIAQVYAQAHVVTLPSYREGLPKSLIEAAACGRAVVTTDVPGCRDAIEPGVTGVLVPVKDAQALARAVIDLAHDTERRQAMGRAGRHLAEQEFDIKHVCAIHLRLYQELGGTAVRKAPSS